MRKTLIALGLCGAVAWAADPPITHFETGVYGHRVEVDRKAGVELMEGSAPAGGLIRQGGRSIPAPACPLPPGGGSLALAKSQARRLTPGSYSTIDLRNSCRLTLAPGDYRVGQLDLRNSSTVELEGPVALFVGSSLSVQNSAELNAGGKPGDLHVYQADPASPVSVTVENSAVARMAAAGPSIKVSLDNHGSLWGSVIAGSVVLDGFARVHYDSRLQAVPIRQP